MIPAAVRDSTRKYDGAKTGPQTKASMAKTAKAYSQDIQGKISRKIKTRKKKDVILVESGSTERATDRSLPELAGIRRLISRFMVLTVEG